MNGVRVVTVESAASEECSFLSDGACKNISTLK